MFESHDKDGAASASYQPMLIGFSNNIGFQEARTPNGVRILSDVEKSWLAGVIDGEGSIYISKVTPRKKMYRRGYFYKPCLSVANSNPDFLNRVAEVIGKGSFHLDKEKKQPATWKEKWQYQGSGLVLRDLLPQVISYLVVKRKNAEKMIEYLKFIDSYPIGGPTRVPAWYDEKLDSLYYSVKSLNQKGIEESSEELASYPRSWGPKNRGRGGRAKECRQLTESEKAWLAGVIDGEGSIFLSKVSNYRCRRGFFYLPQISVSNTNRVFLVKVAKIIGEGTVAISTRGDARWKTKWMYSATAGVLRTILPQILSYLIAKRCRAQKMIEFLAFIDSNPLYGLKEVPLGYYEELDALYRAMRKLNRKGKVIREDANQSER